METPIKMDDLGFSHIFGNIHITSTKTPPPKPARIYFKQKDP